MRYYFSQIRTYWYKQGSMNVFEAVPIAFQLLVYITIPHCCYWG